ncbi:MAG TPA: hypothetical protein DCE14_09115 [Kosmotogaceae bacterium]|nr:MAG: hypothetical protein XE05_0476 [Thermotogales bacterium 46_20]HAA86487.1 hypothetical protein [Kosmotogaceae bacterium]
MAAEKYDETYGKMELEDAEKEKAVSEIAQQMKKSSLKRIRKLREKEGELWWKAYHYSYGLEVRKILRDAGFNWEEGTVDAFWPLLAEEAAEKVLGKK